MSDMTKAELVKQNSWLKMDNDRLRERIRNMRLINRIKSAIRILKNGE